MDTSIYRRPDIDTIVTISDAGRSALDAERMPISPPLDFNGAVLDYCGNDTLLGRMRAAEARRAEQPISQAGADMMNAARDMMAVSYPNAPLPAAMVVGKIEQLTTMRPDTIVTISEAGRAALAHADRCRDSAALRDPDVLERIDAIKREITECRRVSKCADQLFYEDLVSARLNDYEVFHNRLRAQIACAADPLYPAAALGQNVRDLVDDVIRAIARDDVEHERVDSREAMARDEMSDRESSE